MEPLVLTVPERLHERGVEQLARALEGAAGASVVVLTGEPGRFCLGMDFEEAVRDGVRPRLERFARFVGALAACPRPTLAVVDGDAFGGGLGLAAACDYVLATHDARFALPEALYGLAPAIIRPVLESRVSPAQLRLLLFTARSRSATEAAALGLVDELATRDVLDRAVRTAVRQLARARSATVVVARTWQRELHRSLAAGVEETAAALADPAVRAALHEDVPWQT